MKNLLFLFFLGAIVTMSVSCNISDLDFKTVLVDDDGIIRWNDTQKELALFGANYCLPSASDYRAAGLFTDDRKKVVEQDMTHFARMGWDGLRLCFWGDWENTDKAGNLIINDHLDLMDYVIYKARERGIYMLLSPVVTYSSIWPDAMNDTASVDGFSTHYKKDELGTNPDAIAAQCNYWKQLLNHVNPYTGIALKDEPSILFLETINEANEWHYSDDIEGSIDYYNAIADAIKSTGCNKLIFHNYSRNNKVGKALKSSKIDGATFAWYPTGLNSGHTLEGNYLRTVDNFPPMLNPDIEKIPRIVYEFDSPDMNTGYMYPAMMRTFKSVGAQFATMFSYDMLVTAPYNQGWNTHLLNMVYTPSKAASAIISAQAMKKLPLYKQYGNYPENTSFGDFRVSYDENLGVMNTPEIFMYSNSTTDEPKNTVSLKQIVGVGSSPVVDYDGLGIYFLDKIEEGVWRLEVYPDAVTVEDPFGIRKEPRVVIRLISKEWPMKLDLTDLENSFSINPINAGNEFSGKTENGEFSIRPGVYVLSSGTFDKSSLPEKLGQLGFTEFVCPADEQLPTQVSVKTDPEYTTDQPISITAQVASANTPDKVELIARLQGKTVFQKFEMKYTSPYNYSSEIPFGTFKEGELEFFVEVSENEQTLRFKKQNTSKTDENNNFTTKLVKTNSPLVIFSPESDYRQLSFSRIGDNIRRGIFKIVDGPDKQKIVSMNLPITIDSNLKDYTASFIIKDRINSRIANLSSLKNVCFKAKGSHPGTAVVSLVEADGTTWVKKLDVTADWKEYRILLADLEAGSGVILPQAYPENWSYWYWMTPASGRGGQGDKIKLPNIERLLISMRPNKNEIYTSDPTLEIGGISLNF